MSTRQPLLTHRARPNNPNPSPNPNLKQVRALLAHRADPSLASEGSSEGGVTALSIAAEMGHAEVPSTCTHIYDRGEYLRVQLQVQVGPG